MTHTPPPGHSTTPPPVPLPAPPLTLDRERPLVAAGVALLATAVVLSAAYSRADGQLDWSNYAVGLLATLGLLGIAVTSYVLAPETDPATDLVTWPAAFGIGGVGLMIGVAMDDSDATAYVAGLAVVVLSLGGLLRTRRGPFVVTGILGLYAVYLQATEDIVGFDGDEEVGGIPIALGLAIFAALVTALGWLLPETRVLAAAVVGAITVVGFATLTGALALAQAFQAALSVFDPSEEPAPRFDAYDNDAWVILVLALLLIGGWAVLAALTRHVVFRILMVAMAVSVIPLVTAVLTVDHPSWWGLVLGAAGGGLLAFAGVRALAASRR
ncbi:hypothetical protein [Nocardioides sp. cx-173]|uniref:hypothetical protein n=1 Tax=Nocardioides sp. cx-173 TaxID=2898796 RepID=UPI001E29C6A0|nr:hypothetical protein [Nocardioides sp. cx-173]MCD4523635.1 hypothetical protein [Nocardioides sp. cx-173]UGB42032.1 hypothetical protein LQ940_00515 [Nocardioides sp. cx-173]